jgi:hypothetical protein
MYKFAAIAGGAEAAICDKPLWKHRRRWECCRGSKRRMKEGVKSLSCN